MLNDRITKCDVTFDDASYADFEGDVKLKVLHITIF